MLFIYANLMKNLQESENNPFTLLGIPVLPPCQGYVSTGFFFFFSGKLLDLKGSLVTTGSLFTKFPCCILLMLPLFYFTLLIPKFAILYIIIFFY